MEQQKLNKLVHMIAKKGLSTSKGKMRFAWISQSPNTSPDNQLSYHVSPQSMTSRKHVARDFSVIYIPKMGQQHFQSFKDFIF